MNANHPMNPARLAEIETRGIIHSRKELLELIAALREAWRERDAVTELFEELQRISGDSVQLQARAERAAADRNTLQAMWTVLSDAAKDILNADRLYDKVPLEKLVNLEHAIYSEHHDTIVPILTELERLRAVREAAEAYLQTYGEHPDSRGSLRRALDAAQDPAR